MSEIGRVETREQARVRREPSFAAKAVTPLYDSPMQSTLPEERPALSPGSVRDLQAPAAVSRKGNRTPARAIVILKVAAG